MEFIGDKTALFSFTSTILRLAIEANKFAWFYELIHSQIDASVKYSLLKLDVNVWKRFINFITVTKWRGFTTKEDPIKDCLLTVAKGRCLCSN